MLDKTSVFISCDLQDICIAKVMVSFLNSLYDGDTIFSTLEHDFSENRDASTLLSTIRLHSSANVQLIINPRKSSIFLNGLIKGRKNSAKCFVLMDDSKELFIPENFDYKLVKLDENGINELLADLKKILNLPLKTRDAKGLIDSIKSVDPNEYVNKLLSNDKK